MEAAEAAVRRGPRLAHTYRHQVASDPRRERMLIGSVAFFTGFLGARGITHAIRAGVGPFRNLSVGGRHLHHMVFGIGGLLATGYLWLLMVGTDPKREAELRATAASFGLASALTLDEFALWLDLQDVYWAKQGRRSIDAAVIFGGLLSIGLWGSPLIRELGAGLRRLRPQAGGGR